MQLQGMQHRRHHGFACGRRQSLPIGPRLAIVTNAKRKGVSKELRELQQLKDSPAPTAPATTPAAAPATPPPASAPTAASSTPSKTASAQVQEMAPSTSASSTSATITSNSTSNSGTPNSSGLFDNLLVRILASVTAIMAVISVFYSIVFYGASNAVYIFKDQLAAITKKDFVPYSERRRLEQEVLAKLEAEQAERLRARGDGVSGDVSAEGSSQEGPAAAAEAEDAGSSAELLNLLPSSSTKK